MEEKKSVKISLSTFFLFIAIVVIIGMALYIYTEKINSNKEIADLEANATNMQDKIDELQGKIDSISNTINSDNISNDENNTNNASNTENNTITLKIGNYTVNEVKDDEGGVSNEECGVKLEENNKFQIYMGWGAWHSGKYEIKNNKLICTSTLLEWDGGAGAGERATDVIFTFDIVNSNKLKLSNIDINDTDNEKLVYKDGLTIGMTYSIK